MNDFIKHQPLIHTELPLNLVRREGGEGREDGEGGEEITPLSPASPASPLSPSSPSSPLSLSSPSSPSSPPKFSIGDEVIWACVEAGDFGVIIARLWTNETVHKVTGWHYLVRLHPNSFSSSFCQQDWAYQDDLRLLSEFHQREGQSLE